MSIVMKQPGKPDAATLAERIKVAEREHAALVTAHDQAESEATAAAADESSYADASEKASAAQTRVKDCGERLDRLKRQYATQFETEKSAFIADLTARIDRAKANQSEGSRQLAIEEEAERRRHDEALAEIGRKRNEFAKALSDLQRQLKWAESGVLPARAAEAMNLLEEKRSLGERLHKLNLVPVINEAKGEILRIERALQASSISPITLSKKAEDELRNGMVESLAEWREKLKKAERDFLPIQQEHRDIAAKIKAIVGDY